MDTDYWILLASCVAPLAILLGLAQLHNWRVRRQKTRVPVPEKLLRAPGEGLRRKLEVLEDKLSESLAIAFVLPVAYTGFVLLQRHKLAFDRVSLGIALGAGAIGVVVLCRRVLRLLEQRRNHRLGLSGERAVGEELNQLMLLGCRVYHDVPNEPYGNIDHVLVAPSGVYAVETKTRRKKEGKDTHKAVFDGCSLRFGDGLPERTCLDQAKQQASRLSTWLSKASGGAVNVHPVLALPGWYVDRRVKKSEITVISGKAVKMFAKWQPVLDAARIEQIAYQLDQRCRDVEF